MSGYPNLIGTEEVQNAGRSMQGAANRMQDAAREMQGAAEQMQRNMEDWLMRFELILKEDREIRHGYQDRSKR